MLRSRALPEDFDTSQVLRSPFDGKASPAEGGLPSPRNFVSPNLNGGGGGGGHQQGPTTKMMLTDGFQQQPPPHGQRRDEEQQQYMVSPMNSTAPYISPAASDRNAEHYSQSMSRGPLSAPVPTFHRGSQDPYSSMSATATAGQPAPREPYAPYVRQPDARYSSNPESLHPGMSHSSVEYGIGRPPSGMMGGYENRQHLSDPPSASVSYPMPSQSAFALPAF